MKNSFVLYTDYIEQIEMLSREQRGDLLTTIMLYAAGEQLPELDDVTKMAFSFIKKQMDKDIEKYEQTVEKRREAGRKGGRPKANDSDDKAKKANGFSEKQSKAKKPDNDNVNDNDNDNVNDIKKNIVQKPNELFERLWKLYPEKKGKGQVSEASKRRLLDIGYEQMERVINRYKADLDKDRAWRKPQNGSTFFNSGYVDYLDINYQKEEEDHGRIGEKAEPVDNGIVGQALRAGITGDFEGF